MDAPRAESDVETYIPPAIKEAAEFVAGFTEGSVYLSGGALLPHVTQDYDLLIKTTMPTDDIEKNIKGMCKKIPGMHFMKLMSSYHDTPEGVWRMIIKIKYQGASIDLLVVPGSDSIRSIMQRYPLSIQKQALWLAGRKLYINDEVYHKDFTPPGDNLIIVHSMGAALEKYMKYYPKHAFLLLPGSGGANE